MIQDENMENSPRDHLKPGGATGQKQSFRYHPNSSFSKMLDLQHQPKLRHSYLGAAGISGFYSHGVSPSHSQSSLRPEEERHNETVLPKSKFGIQLIGVDPKDNEPDSEMRAAIQDQLNSSSEEQDGEAEARERHRSPGARRRVRGVPRERGGLGARVAGAPGIRQGKRAPGEGRALAASNCCAHVTVLHAGYGARATTRTSGVPSRPKIAGSRPGTAVSALSTANPAPPSLT